MPQTKLNIYVFYAIFNYFVAIDPSGPYTLMLVCVEWQIAVLNTPSLWCWVTLDEGMSDNEMRIAIAAALSHDLPLQLTMRVPISEEQRRIIHPYSQRIQCLSLEIPYSTEAVELVRSRRIPESFPRLTTLNHAHIRWYFQGQEVFLSPITIDVINRTNVRHPSNLISHLVIDNSTSHIRFALLVSLLSSLPHLGRLELNPAVLSGPSDWLLPNVELEHLKELKSSSEWRHNVHMDKLFSIVSVPNLKYFSITGTIGDFSSAMGSLIANKVPKEIGWYMEPSWTTSYEDTTWKQIAQALLYVEKLTLHCRNGLQRMGVPNIRSLAKSMAHLPSYASLNLSLEDPDCSFISHLIPSRYHLNISHYECSKFSTAVAVHVPLMKWDPEAKLVINKLSLIACMPRSLAVVPNSPHFWNFRRFLRPNYSLQELDLSSADLTCEDLRLLDVGEGDSLFPLLVSLRCEIQLAALMIHVGAITAIERLWLTKGSMYLPWTERFFENFSELVTEIMTLNASGEPKCPHLYTLSIDLHPPWAPLFKMLHFMVKYHRRQPIFHVTLPNLPHISILRPLVDTLTGAEPPIDEIMPKWMSPVTYRNSLSNSRCCYNCYIGGWDCKRSSGCHHHATCEGVTVTQYTLSGIAIMSDLN